MTTEAIIFFGDNNVVKEMLYPEFEAILDHVVGIQEFSSQQVNAVYLRINTNLKVIATVFFTCQFDADGNADSAWNIPLAHLADKAAGGPDLGAGPIKLSCRSQCSVSWHQRELWDPVTDAKPSTFEKIKALIKRNRLGLAVEAVKPAPAEADIPVLMPAKSQPIDKSMQEVMVKKIRAKLDSEFKALQSSLMNEQKLKIATLKSEAREHVEKLHRHYRGEKSELELQLSEAKQFVSDEKNKNKRYKQTLESQAQGLHDERERFQDHLAAAKTIETDQLNTLQDKFERELQAELEKSTADLKEMLEMRDVELFYRQDQMSSLRDEVAQLRTEKQALLSDGGDKLLSRLVQAGITFVAYQPGLDHLAVPQLDLFDYLESPALYVAEKYGVDVSLYEQWLVHYQLPVCQHPIEDSICGEPIDKVERPVNFIPNDSDRCSRHNFSACDSAHVEQA